MNSEERIQELEAKVAELTAFVEQVRQASVVSTVADPPTAMVSQPAAAIEPVETIETVQDAEVVHPPKTASRRGMLKLAGAAAAGAAAAVAANAMPAAAADGGSLIAGGEVDTTAANRNTTELVYTNTLTPEVPSILFGTSPANIFVARDAPDGPFILFDPSSSGYPAAVAGYSYRTVANGMYGYTAMSGAGVVGQGAGAAAVGVQAGGVGANLELLPAGTAPSARTDAHRLGQVICDTTGDTWICVVAGTPGTFRKLAGAATSGSLHLLAAPKRVYDSRVGEAPAIDPKTPLTNLVPRTIDCTGNSSGVPANASGVLLNVTAISITPNGFLAVTPGGAGFTGTSTLNWTAANAVIANAATTACGAGAKIDVTAGGGGSTNVLVDVFGYYL